VHVDTVHKPAPGYLSLDTTQESVMSVVKNENWRRNFSKSKQILAAVSFELSNNHVRYTVIEPKLLDWLAFLGGISVIYFLIGKLVNHFFFRKKFVSPMMDKLF